MQWRGLESALVTIVIIERTTNRLQTCIKPIDLEEEVGFEPTVPYGTPDFESGTFGHSATLPHI